MNEFDDFVTDTINKICTYLELDMYDVMNAWKFDYAVGLQRHYVQAGPWADMIREG